MPLDATRPPRVGRWPRSLGLGVAAPGRMALGVVAVHEVVVSAEIRVSLVVAAEAQQVERTRRKTWSQARSEILVPYTGLTDQVSLGRGGDPGTRGRPPPHTTPSTRPPFQWGLASIRAALCCAPDQPVGVEDELP